MAQLKDRSNTTFKNKENLITNIDVEGIEKHVAFISAAEANPQYVPGDIVCGKLGQFPWWPCVVIPHHIDNAENTPNDARVFVRYFDKKQSVSLLRYNKVLNIHTLAEYEDYLQIHKKERLQFNKRKAGIIESWNEVEDALKMTREERIDKYKCTDVLQVKKSVKKRKIPKTSVPKVLKDSEKKKEYKECAKEPLKYGFTELTLPLKKEPMKAKCCRYCLVCDKDVICCKEKYCKRYFHQTCAKDLLIKVREIYEEYCVECTVKYCSCFMCSKKVEVNEESLCCSQIKCQKKCHTSCQDVGSFSEMIRKSVDRRIKCPEHLCHKCELVYMKPRYEGNILQHCIMCSATYHTGDWCLPAGSVSLSDTEMICPRHLPCGEYVAHSIPPFVARVSSNIQVSLYGNSLADYIDTTVTIPAKNNLAKIPSYNSCFNCGNGGVLLCCESCPATYHKECVKDNQEPAFFFCNDCRFGNYPTYGEITWVKTKCHRWWPSQIMHHENVPKSILARDHKLGQFVVQFFGTHDYFWTDPSTLVRLEDCDLKIKLETCVFRIGLDKKFNLGNIEAKEALKLRNRVWSDSTTALKNKHFTRIKVNRYSRTVKKPKAIDLNTYNRCNCKDVCHYFNNDMNNICDNVNMKYECHPKICNLIKDCKNRNFTLRNYPKQEVFDSGDCGWAVKTKVNIQKNELVNEYVGEIINNDEMHRRREWAMENNVNDFYFMTLDNERVIDARFYSNLSRFINHSCTPNLISEKWFVHDDIRIGLFALRDISANEELTFNYNLVDIISNQIPCLCKTVNCSGFIGRTTKMVNRKTKSPNETYSKKQTRSKGSVIKDRKTSVAGSMTNSSSTVSMERMSDIDKKCCKCYMLCDELDDISCTMFACERIYHRVCLKLPDDVDTSLWICPWHHCDNCGRLADVYCQICIVSYCTDHVDNNILRTISDTEGAICYSHFGF